MNILERIDEQIDFMVANPHFEVVADEKLFADMANFLIDIDPEQLTDSQLLKMVEIFTNLESEAEQVAEEIKAKKTPQSKKTYAAGYYGKKKNDIKKKKVELEKSIKGETRKRMKPIMAKGRKTSTGRHKVTYHTYK